MRPNPIDVEKAAIKARILTGTYTLQSNRAKFNQHDVDPTCLLCKECPENRQHFILTCKLTEPARQKFLTKIIDTVQSSKLDVNVSNLCNWWWTAVESLVSTHSMKSSVKI